MLYSEFLSVSDFESVRKYAEVMNVSKPLVVIILALPINVPGLGGIDMEQPRKKINGSVL